MDITYLVCELKLPLNARAWTITANHVPMVEELTKEQSAMLKKTFDMFDKDKKGFIHTSMVATILRSMGQSFEDRDLMDLIDEIDADGYFMAWHGSGELEFEEFQQLAARFVVEEDSEAMQEELRGAFRLFAAYPLCALDDKLTEDELDEMITEIDTDGSGTVDFDEFMEMMTGD
uniref:EF-hand domain-containing protein n=1 Tax=Strigamia maritima TaxID=126957 RepID=T1JDJ5_STRMM